MKPQMRTGIGFDAHRFETGRHLVIGGVEIPHDKGLGGHSDADVLLHAICDAILGAAGLPDIGHHFPDNDAQFKNISSLDLLQNVCEIIKQHGFHAVQIDSIVIAETPKISPFVDQMKNRIARVLGLEPSAIGIKATTTEGMGFTGRGEGIAAQAIAMLTEP
ncbi:MAG: 2-C-methyl-D-erythritol 2,4-cyclodiphosphate synthase [bacterium]